MTAWKALFRKELRVGSLGFIMILGIELAVIILGLYLQIRGQQKLAVSVTGVFLIGCHFFYLFGYLMINVIIEKKTLHLWLNHPLPGWSLLAAKLAGGVVGMTVSLFIACIYTWTGFMISGQMNNVPEGLHIYRIAAAAIFFLYWVAIYGGITFLLIWLAFRCMRTRVGRAAWLLMIFILGLAVFLIGKLTQAGVTTALMDWGPLPEPAYHFFVSASLARELDLSSMPVYLGNFVVDLVIMLIFYGLSSWLLDRKMEVG
ncbi:hypothetical protein ABNN70_04700 [Sporolactobacillus sp. Y61]|uniref:ABC transporter permease n=1 Tax=Sporolactobacillus sp. Y61 TaxID=3160863 RepID=A0AAU8IGX4_9BACL